MENAFSEKKSLKKGKKGGKEDVNCLFNIVDISIRKLMDYLYTYSKMWISEEHQLAFEER